MRGYRKFLAAVAPLLVLGATVVTAQDIPEKNAPEKNTQGKSSGSSMPWYNPARYNPLKLFKHYKSANDQLASDGHLEDKLSKQLRIQGILAQDRELQDEELEAATGGIIAVLIGLLLSDARPSTPPPPASK